MKPRRLLSLATAAGLAFGALGAVAPTSQAATSVCRGLVTGVDASNHVIYRSWEGATIGEEKKSADPLPISPQYLLWSGFRELGGGAGATSYTAYRYGQAPQVFDVVNKTSAPTLSVKYVRKYSRPFSGRLVTLGGSYYVYAVDGNGTLHQWTRYVDDAGRVWIGSPKTVAKYLGGLKTLSYSWTFKIDGVYKDVLYGTTANGKLLQFQIPLEKPSNEKITRLASGGFGAYDWVSPAGCNKSPHYLALVAIDKETNQARLYSLPSQTVPKVSNLANRGLVGDGADWNLRAVG